MKKIIYVSVNCCVFAKFT